jgi:hypothetical protein
MMAALAPGSDRPCRLKAPLAGPTWASAKCESTRRQSEGRMDDVTARLEALLRRYLAEANRCQGVTAALDRLGEQYRRDIDQLVSEYWQPAVNAAVNEMPDRPWPSVALH